MNTSSETNVNVRLNTISKDARFRIYRGKDKEAGIEHNYYLPQFSNDNGQTWVTMKYYKNDVDEIRTMTCVTIRKCKRFMTKVLTGNGIEVPEDFPYVDENADKRYEIWIDGCATEEIVGEEQFRNRWENLINTKKDYGWQKLEESTQGYCIMVNYKLHKTIFYAYRHNLGFVDCHGQHIYEDDYLLGPEGRPVYIHKRDDGSYYMTMLLEGFGNYKEIDIHCPDDIVNAGVEVNLRNIDRFG